MARVKKEFNKLSDKSKKIIDWNTNKDIAKYKRRNLELLESKVTKNEDGTLIVPVSLAINYAYLTNKPLNNYLIEAEKAGMPLGDYYKYKRSKNYGKQICEVQSTSLIGGNGIGKTECIIEEAIQQSIAQNLNPIVYSDDSGVVYPKNENDILIVHINGAATEFQDLVGIPFSDMIDLPVIDDNGVIKKNNNGDTLFSKEKTVVYSIINKMKSMSNFNSAILFIDEANRSPIPNIIAALINNESAGAIELPRMNLRIFLSGNPPQSGNILNNSSQLDGAMRTKTQTYFVFQTVSEWTKYALEKNIDPVVIAFANQYPEVFEIQNAMDDTFLAFPTFRGLVKFNNSMQEANVAFKSQFGSDYELSDVSLQTLFQSHVGAYPESEIFSGNLSEKFIEFKNDVHDVLLPIIKKSFYTPQDNQYNFGFRDDDLNKFLYKSSCVNHESKARVPYSEKELDEQTEWTGKGDLAASLCNNILPVYVIKIMQDFINNVEGMNLKSFSKADKLDELYGIYIENKHEINQFLDKFENNPEKLNEIIEVLSVNPLNTHNYALLLGANKEMSDEEKAKMIYSSFGQPFPNEYRQYQLIELLEKNNEKVEEKKNEKLQQIMEEVGIKSQDVLDEYKLLHIVNQIDVLNGIRNISEKDLNDLEKIHQNFTENKELILENEELSKLGGMALHNEIIGINQKLITFSDTTLVNTLVRHINKVTKMMVPTFSVSPDAHLFIDKFVRSLKVQDNISNYNGHDDFKNIMNAHFEANNEKENISDKLNMDKLNSMLKETFVEYVKASYPYTRNSQDFIDNEKYTSYDSAMKNAQEEYEYEVDGKKEPVLPTKAQFELLKFFCASTDDTVIPRSKNQETEIKRKKIVNG